MDKAGSALADRPWPDVRDATLGVRLTVPEFAAALAPVLVRSPTGLVLAVSGGPDSVCLMHMMAAACRAAGGLPPIVVATVDHGLRSESAAEAAFVVGEAKTLGFAAHVLAWHGPKPARAIQEAARTARYALLTDLCHELGASHLVTAHTLDDQAETVLFRLARGSGIAGLAGMAAATQRSDILHARPLLGTPKTRLVAACISAGWRFLVDPSNTDPRFARARLRNLLPSLAREGLDAQGLARFAQRAARADAALTDAANAASRSVRREAPTGTEVLDGGMLARLPEEIVIRVLGGAVQRVGPGKAARLDRLESLAADLMDALRATQTLRRTLNGTTVVLSGDATLTVRPEGIRRRGTPARRLPVHSPADELPHSEAISRGSLGKGGTDAYIEPRRNAASLA